MYDRLLEWPKKTSFLFGPRSTGKSSWIRATGKDVFLVDLLNTTLSLRFERSPEDFRELILGNASPEQWVVVDEVQKNPRLLDEVQNLMENHGYKKFLLTGSSARKLRRSTANLLGGRARKLNFFPLTAFETGFEGTADSRLKTGCLPEPFLESDQYEQEAFLKGYIENYLIDEIKRETSIRNMAGFQRFLEIAAICSTKPISLQNIARDAQISRESVKLYFEVLIDTLIGYELPAFQERIKVKEVATPKFYFFDSGVVNSAAGYLNEVAPSDWNGVLMETWIGQELRAFLDLNRIKGKLFYWATPSGTEVDFVWKYGKQLVLIEVKSSRKFRREFLSGIRSFQSSRPGAKGYVVYLGDEVLQVEGVDVVPAMIFLKWLYDRKTPISI